MTWSSHLKGICDIFNYSDDNTVTCHGITIPEVKKKAETVINKMLCWFKINQMKVNDDIILYFCKNKTINDEYMYVSVGSNEIMSSSYVKLLGVYFDQKLSYD